LRGGLQFGYWGFVVVLLGLLLILRSWTGVAVFSLLAWIYNIAHFVKAEVYFSGVRKTRVSYYTPVIAFTWFTLCLFRVGPLKDSRLVFAGSILLAAAVLLLGGWRLLASGEILIPC
jgi:hypothetical protein